MEDYSEEVCIFKKSAMLTMDLMVDSYKWKKLADHAESPELKAKYTSLANMLLELFNTEYEVLQQHYRED